MSALKGQSNVKVINASGVCVCVCMCVCVSVKQWKELKKKALFVECFTSPYSMY